MASQHDSTTQVIYSIGSEERDITNMGLMTQHSEHTSQSTNGSLSCLSTALQKKRHIRDILGRTKIFSVIHMTLL